MSENEIALDEKHQLAVIDSYKSMAEHSKWITATAAILFGIAVNMSKESATKIKFAFFLLMAVAFMASIVLAAGFILMTIDLSLAMRLNKPISKADIDKMTRQLVSQIGAFMLGMFFMGCMAIHDLALQSLKEP